MSRKHNLEGDHAKAFSVLERKINAQLETYLNSCVHCGLCSTSCHYYLY